MTPGYSWGLNDSKSPLIIIISILTAMSFTNLKLSHMPNTVPIAPSIIHTILTFMFHIFLSSLVRSWYVTIFFFTLSHVLICTLITKLHSQYGMLFITYSQLSHLILLGWEVGLNVKILNLFFLFSRSTSSLCWCHLFTWSNPNYLHSSSFLIITNIIFSQYTFLIQDLFFKQWN